MLLGLAPTYSACADVSFGKLCVLTALTRCYCKAYHCAKLNKPQRGPLQWLVARVCQRTPMLLVFLCSTDSCPYACATCMQ